MSTDDASLPQRNEEACDKTSLLASTSCFNDFALLLRRAFSLDAIHNLFSNSSLDFELLAVKETEATTKSVFQGLQRYPFFACLPFHLPKSK